MEYIHHYPVTPAGKREKPRQKKQAKPAVRGGPIDDEDIRMVRMMWAEHKRLRREAMALNAQAIAEKMGITPCTVYRIVNGKRYGDVK